MKKEDLCAVQYISCVEAYFGAWIKDRVSLGALYSESFLSWEEIHDEFMRGEITYATFSGIRRLQDFAESVGLIKHEMKKSWLIQADFTMNDLTLLRVKNDFCPQRKAWRDDHYIAIEKYTNKKITYLNQFPLEERAVSTEEVKRSWDGMCLVYRNDNIYAKDMFSEIARRQEKHISHIEKQGISQEITDIVQLRDAIGILRVSRRRTLEWLHWYSNEFKCDNLYYVVDSMKRQLRAADQAYLQLHMALVRSQNMTKDILQNIVRDLDKYEYELLEGGRRK